MKTITYLIVTLLFFNSAISYAQDIIGFWEIKKVIVGGKTMTPVAKWTKINKDGTFQSGNGWLQNATGTWQFDKKKNLYSPTETNGLKDEFGPFTIEVNKDKMTWLREEEGSIVTVSLERITKMPKATADELVGLWNLSTIIKNEKEITATFDPSNTYYLFIRWDRIYMKRTPEGNRSTGYWHINGHRPEVTFLSHDKNKTTESWKVETSDKTLKMIGISDANKNTVMSFKRLDAFPK